MRLTRGYLAFFGVLHLPHLLSLLGLYETIAEAPPILSLWWWHIVLLLVYGALPILYAVRGGETTRIAVMVACTAGVLVEAFRVFTWAWDVYWVYLGLAVADFLAAAAAIIDKF